jgi:predicted metal-binding membrane protein
VPSTTAVRTAGALLAGSLAAWIVILTRMRGMDAGPGMDLGSLGFYLGIWVTMTAAMMLPSTMPTVIAYRHVGRHPRAGTTSFLAGYLAAWTGYGLVAFAIYRSVRAAAPGFLQWNAGGRYLAGAALAAAGLYELTPLKTLCLRHCRSPLGFVLGRWRPGRLGALRMGMEHGADCVGCCFGLMLALFVLGLMSLLWMAVVASVIFAEKVLPAGDRLPRAVAASLSAVGLWLAVAPATVPGLMLS